MILKNEPSDFYCSRDFTPLKSNSGDYFLVHYHYQLSSQDVRSPFDAAVIKLVDEIHKRTAAQRTTLPICRSDDYRRPRNRYGIAIGLGFTNLNPLVRAERLMQTSIHRIDNSHPDFEDCRISNPVQICYGLFQGSSMTDTDFGSPLIVQKGGIAICLIGVSSFTIYIPVKEYFANIFTPGVKLRHWLNVVFMGNFTDKNFRHRA